MFASQRAYAILYGTTLGPVTSLGFIYLELNTLIQIDHDVNVLFCEAAAVLCGVEVVLNRILRCGPAYKDPCVS